jgi:hypothetical protein
MPTILELQVGKVARVLLRLKLPVLVVNLKALPVTAAVAVAPLIDYYRYNLWLVVHLWLSSEAESSRFH